jgi:hypothetical protein
MNKDTRNYIKKMTGASEEKLDAIDKILKASAESRSIGKDEQGKRDCSDCKHEGNEEDWHLICNPKCLIGSEWEQSC